MTDETFPAAAPPSHILEAAVYCDDLNAAEAFYAKVLGLERIQRIGDRHVFFRLGTGVLLVFNPTRTVEPPNNPDMPVPPHGARGQSHVCFAMPGDAMDDWRRRLKAAGVEIDADFKWPNGARSLYFRDPCGNSIELAEPWLWSG